MPVSKNKNTRKIYEFLHSTQTMGITGTYLTDHSLNYTPLVPFHVLEILELQVFFTILQ